MELQIKNIFKDINTVKKVQEKLPKLFHIAELESSRANKIGMEVGSLRERIIIAFLIYKFGDQNVKTDIPITSSEVDVIVSNTPISIKTISGQRLSGIKLVWTVDKHKAREFVENYVPSCDMILVQINWNSEGGFFYISKEIQREVLKSIGADKYFKLPVEGTNPRGVEITGYGADQLILHQDTLKFDIQWRKEAIDFKPFQRWLELWERD